MTIELLLPSLSPTMEEGTIASWHVKPGDKVEPGQVIAEVQTDKTVVEWEALDDGYVGEIVIPEGQQAKVNMVAALLTPKKGGKLGDAVEKAKAKNEELAGGAGAPAADEPAAAAAPAPAAAAPTPVAPPPPTPRAAPAPAPVAVAPAAAPKKIEVSSNVRISPVAARLASEKGVDLGSVTGTGTDGRIVRRDVEAAFSNGSRSKGAKSNPFLAQRPEFQDVAVTPMRQVIGKRLLESKTSIPHFYVNERIDVRKLVALRSQLNAVDGVKITFNDLVVKAVALTLVRHPEVNSTFHGDIIRQYGTADISIAVAIPDGLITPILHGAEQLTLSQINAKVKDLAKRAMGGTLAPEEYQGGSFTISNLGMFGIEEFSAIINPPQAAILAVGGIKDEAIVDNGELVPGKTMRVTLSADHRVVDGAVGAAFIKDLRELLENPAALML